MSDFCKFRHDTFLWNLVAGPNYQIFITLVVQETCYFVRLAPS